MATYRIPLSATAQTFTITLAGVERQLTVRWNDADEAGCVLDIQKPDNAGDIVCGIPLVTGCDLLAPYGYLALGGRLVVWGQGGDDAPAVDNLGDGVDLYFLTEDA